MDLAEVWFVAIAVLWTGYFFLEGFDFGVGIMMPFLGRHEDERSQVLSTIGPIWDANEVWLITAGAAMFAAFPYWYATLFSGFYPALFFILVALIIRAVALEWRGRVDSNHWKRFADGVIFIGSLLPPLLWGVAFSNIVAGVPINKDGDYTGSILTLLNPFALIGGLAFVAIFVFHGLNFLSLKTAGAMRERAESWAPKAGVIAAVVAGGFLVWEQLDQGKGWTWIFVIFAAIAIIASIVAARSERSGVAFALTGAAIAATVVVLFGNLHPFVMPSSTDPSFSLTIDNASSTPYTLSIMSWLALFALPAVMVYQGWSYWVFRSRVRIDDPLVTSE